MADLGNPFADIVVPGLRVTHDRGWRVMSLRYFRPDGPFAAEFREWSGIALPEPQTIIRTGSAAALRDVTLAWRSPSETLVFGREAPPFDLMRERISRSTHGCAVEQTGGLWVVQATGSRVTDLLLRIGSTASVPAAGEARISRIAEIAVLAMCAIPGETWLVVDRAYAEHLFGWIRVTAGDFGAD